MAGPLQGLRVVEMKGLGPAPFCGMLLADMGAEVLRIARSDSDDPHDVLARGRSTLEVDLRAPGTAAAVLDAIAQADILIEGFRPGVMERLGLGPAECLAANPRLVYGRMTGWGQDGPLAPRAGHDNNYAALSGALWGCSPADARPVSSFALLGDIGGGALYLMTGVLAGVIKARETGAGSVVDAAIVDGAAHMLNLALSARQRGVVADVRGQSIHDSSPFYETYVCADGHHITLGSIEPQFHALLLQTLGLENDADFSAPGSQWDKTAWPKRRARLQAIFITQDRAHWQQLLEPTDVCFGAVMSPLEASQHPHMQARGVYSQQGGVLQAAPAPRFDGQAYPVQERCLLGQDTEEITQSVLVEGQSAWRSREAVQA